LYCRELESLVSVLSEVGTPYEVVERILGYPRHRETLSVHEASLRISCDDVCRNLHELRELMINSRACVVFPGTSGVLPQNSLNDCDVLVAAESAARILTDAGLRPTLVVTDLDGPLDLLSSYSTLSRYLSIHVHGDNLSALLEHGFPRNAIYTSQVEGEGCVIGPLGFTDGDRAATIPMILGSEEIRLVGFDTRTPQGKRFYNPQKLVKVGIGYLIIHYYAARLGYRLKETSRGSLTLTRT